MVDMMYGQIEKQRQHQFGMHFEYDDSPDEAHAKLRNASVENWQPQIPPERIRTNVGVGIMQGFPSSPSAFGLIR